MRRASTLPLNERQWPMWPGTTRSRLPPSRRGCLAFFVQQFYATAVHLCHHPRATAITSALQVGLSHDYEAATTLSEAAVCAKACGYGPSRVNHTCGAVWEVLSFPQTTPFNAPEVHVGCNELLAAECQNPRLRPGHAGCFCHTDIKSPRQALQPVGHHIWRQRCQRGCTPAHPEALRLGPRWCSPTAPTPLPGCQTAAHR